MLSVDVNDTLCEEKLQKGLKLLIGGKKLVVLCIGCQKVVGDSLGPLVGTKLVETLSSDTIVYGMLDSNINARNLMIVSNMIKALHPDRTLLAIDAALGKQGEVGSIQVYTHGLYPGSATNKNLPCIGDISIIGVVNQKVCAFELSMLYTAKSITVNTMAQKISSCISKIANQ